MHSEAEAHFSLSVDPEAQQQPRSGTHPGGSGTNAFWLIPLNSIVSSCEKKYSLFRIIVPSRHAIPNFSCAVPGTTQREKCLHLTRAYREKSCFACSARLVLCITCTIKCLVLNITMHRLELFHKAGWLLCYLRCYLSINVGVLCKSCSFCVSH